MIFSQDEDNMYMFTVLISYSFLEIKTIDISSSCRRPPQTSGACSLPTSGLLAMLALGVALLAPLLN